MVTFSALHPWFELAEKQISEERLLSLLKVLPIFKWYFCIRSSFGVFNLKVWLFRHFIHVLMETFQKDREHFLRVLLSESSKLNCFPSHNLFDVPRCDISLVTYIHLLYKLSKCGSQPPSRAISIPLVNVPLVYAINVKFNEWLSISQALQNTAHEASVA